MQSESKAKTKWVRREIHLAVAILIVSLIAYFFSINSHVSMVSVDDAIFNVEVADSSEERSKGLSGRPALANDEGMLLIYDESKINGIWMRDMNFSIDILWIDENLRVVHIEEKISPSTYPEIFYPNLPAKYILEVYSGQVEAQGLSLGDQVVLDI